MLSNLKPSEKILLGVTVLAMLLYIAWSFGLEEAFEGAGGDNSVVLAAEQDFQENLEAVGRKPEIERRYRDIEQRVAGDKKTRADLAFQEEVGELCRTRGFQIRSIKASTEEVEGVEDYELINVALRVEGNFDQTVQLLKSFHGSNMLFRELELISGIDREQVEARVTISRIAKVQAKGRGKGSIRRF